MDKHDIGRHCATFVLALVGIGVSREAVAGDCYTPGTGESRSSKGGEEDQGRLPRGWSKTEEL
jgi:hypothetical protein